MRFLVLEGYPIPGVQQPTVALVRDNWDDWFLYRTQFAAVYLDGKGLQFELGQVKIGAFEATPPAEGRWTPKLPRTFRVLDRSFFSLGQDAEYYERLNELGASIRDDVLRSLRDLAVIPGLLQSALSEEVTTSSLLRYISPETVSGQFSRLATGGELLTSYSFVYRRPLSDRYGAVSVTFEVDPDSRPPTNIHVLIGRNGVGKTRLLNDICRALLGDRADAPALGEVVGLRPAGPTFGQFAGLVSVSFSAFDPFVAFPETKRKRDELIPFYVGLKESVLGKGQGGSLKSPAKLKSEDALRAEFIKSFESCLQGPRLDRLVRSLQALSSDPVFADLGILEAVPPDPDAITSEELAELLALVEEVFDDLSSGHKIVLLSIVRLVELVEEKTLVLLDEPESHLHPPLLAAYVRAVSELLVSRNGVAIVATHSPVVLQEVPTKCVWILDRIGNVVSANRPTLETFGENIGILTREVFGYEVTESGFHRMVREEALRLRDYDAVLARFSGSLGAEARALCRAILISMDPWENG